MCNIHCKKEHSTLIIFFVQQLCESFNFYLTRLVPIKAHLKFSEQRYAENLRFELFCFIAMKGNHTFIYKFCFRIIFFSA